MSLKTYIGGKLVSLMRSAAATTFSASDIVAAQNIGSAPSAALNVPGANRPAENCILAFACLVARREAIGSAPIVLADEDDNAIESGPIYDLLVQPNGEDDWGQYIRKLETHLTLHNVAAIHVGKDEQPTELCPLNPGGLQAVMGYHGPTGTPRPIRWQYSDPTTGMQREFGPDEVIVSVGYNPYAPLETLSPIHVLDTTIRTEMAARQQNCALFVNDATPRGYLSTDANPTKQQMQEVLDTWLAANQGFANRHKTTITWGGVKYNKIQLSPEELEFFESLRSMRLDYYMALRVYPAMLAEMTGETGLSQGSSTDSQRTAWWEDVGLPELNLIAKLHQRVADRFGASSRGLRAARVITRAEHLALQRAEGRNRRGNRKTYVWFNDSAIPALSRLRLSRVDTYTKLAAGGYRPDDVNDYLETGLPPHPDNKPRVPFNLQVIGEEAEVAGHKSQVAGVKETGGQTLTTASDAVTALERLETALVRADSAAKGKKSELRKRYDAFLAPREKAAARKVSGFFVGQRGRLLERIQKITRDQLQRADQSTESAKSADELLKLIFPRDDENMDLVAKLRPLWAQHMQDGANLLADETGSNPIQIDASPAFKQAVEQREIKGKMINATTEDDLHTLFRDAFDAGDTLGGIADKIAAYYKDNCIGEDAPRSLLIAQAQTAGIVNEGRMIAANEAGGLLKGWLHGGSAEPRPGHVRADQLYMAAPIPLNQKFEFQGGDGELYTCDQPGDSSLPASEVCNCSCMVTFVKAEG